MGIAHDLGLVGASGELNSITCYADTDGFISNCQDIHKQEAKASTAYLLGRVDLMDSRLYASVGGKILGVVQPDNQRLLTALALNQPTICMVELFVGQDDYGCRLHFNTDIVKGL